jgi:hypothetical protein
MQEGRATTANNGANTDPVEALDQENPPRRFLGRVVLVVRRLLLIRYSSAILRDESTTSGIFDWQHPHPIFQKKNEPDLVLLISIRPEYIEMTSTTPDNC